MVAPEAPKPKKLHNGFVRARALKGVLVIEGFMSEGCEFVLAVAEAERLEKRGDVELID